MKPTVAVALSGGLDSAVAATLLKEQGFKVIGLHFLTGLDTSKGDAGSSSPLPRASAHRLAELIDIPLRIVDCSQAFQHKVVRYFVDSYRSGLTPNPCIVCNKHIKFGVVLKQAESFGASALATGHYARLDTTPNGRPCLLKGVDPAKDQSYFLARLEEEQLRHARFPLGTYTKDNVRQLARAWGYTPYAQEESQELCFIGHPSYTDFLDQITVHPKKPGPIVNAGGDVLGHHQGLHAFTIGQRRGIGIPGPEPYYVLRLDSAKNTLVIGAKRELARHECIVNNAHWIGMDPPRSVLSVQTRIRYRHKEAQSVIEPLGDNTMKVCFETAQEAITPGQAAVFYQENRIIGAGWIVG